MGVIATNNIGILLLAIWLILTCLLPLIGLGSAAISLGLAILGIVAGVFLLLGK